MRIRGYEVYQNNTVFRVIRFVIRDNKYMYKRFPNSFNQRVMIVIKIEDFGEFLYDINTSINL